MIHHNSGKTTVLRATAAAYFRGMHPWRKRTAAVKVLAIAPSMQQLATIYKQGFLDSSMLYLSEEKRKADPELYEILKKPLIPEDEIALKPSGVPDIEWGQSKFGRVPAVIRHVDGSELYTHVSGDVNSWKRIEGMDFHAIIRDEAMGNENLGNTLVTRLMEHWDQPEYPTAGFYLWGATELDEKSIEREQFLKNAQDGKRFYAFLSLVPEDNPKVSMKAREEAAEILGEDEANKRVWGTTTAATGSIIFAKHFNRNVHVMKEHYEPSVNANLWVSWDPGWRHPYGIVCAAIEPEEPHTIRVCRCYTDIGQTMDVQINNILDWLDGRFLEGLVYDSHGATKSEYNKGEKAYVQMEDGLRRAGVKIHRGMIPSKSEYKTGIPLMWRYLQPDPSNPEAKPLLLLNPASPKAPGMHTGNPNCQGLIEQFYSYRYKRGQNQNRREAIETINDDLISPLRYLISRHPRWVERPPNHPRHTALISSSIPFRSAVVDPLADDPTAPEDIRVLRQRLRASRALSQEWMQGQGRKHGKRLAVRRISW